MKKRLTYLLMTALFIITTINESIVPIYAVAQTADSNHELSKVVNYRNALETMNSTESVLTKINQEKAISNKQKTTKSESSKQGDEERNTSKILLGRTTKANAIIPANSISDGISNWQSRTTAELGFKGFSQKPTEGLDYTFGSLLTAEDATKETLAGTTAGFIDKNLINGGQINVAVTSKEGSRNIADLTGMYDGSTDSTYPVRQSLGFGLVFDKNAKSGTNHEGAKVGDLSMLANKILDKNYYTAQTPNGLAMKVMGHFTRVDPLLPSKTHQLLVEILLRPSPGKVAAVQQELYIKNESSTIESFGVLFGQDTALGNDSKNDSVPVKSIGDDQGLYMEGATVDFKLLAKMAVPDGPDDFSAPTSIAPFLDWYNAFDGNAYAGNGQKRNGLTKESNTVLTDKGDTSYTAKWDFQYLSPQSTKHFRQDVIAMKGPVVTPVSEKKWTNQSSKDGLNRVGDTGQYKLSVTNSGFQDIWKGIKLTDTKLSNDLKVDDQTIKLTVKDYITAADANAGKGTEGTIITYTADVPASAYDSATQQLTVEPGSLVDSTNGHPVPADLGDNDSVEIDFNARIKASASGKTISNHFDVTGTDANNNHPVITDGADNTFDVQKVADPTSMTKLVRNVSSDSQSKFVSTAEASAGDHVQYQIETTVSPNNPLSGAKFKDVLDSALKLTKTQVQYQKTDGTWDTPIDASWDGASQLTLSSSVAKGAKVRIIIDATIADKVTSGQVINNTAELVAGSYGVGTTPDADAKLSIVDKRAIEKDSLHQYIKNLTQKDSSDTLSKTTGYVGDKVQYTFTGKSDAGNTQKLTKLAIEQIKMAPTNSMSYVDDSLKINGATATATIQQAFKDGNYAKIDILDELDKDTQFTVTYEMTVSADAEQNITNDGWLTATKLDGSVAIDTSNPDDKGLKFGTTTLTVKKPTLLMTKQVGLYSGTAEPTSFSDGVEARPGDKVQYRVELTPDKQNELRDITVQDVFDSDLKVANNVAKIQRQKADGSWGNSDSVAIDAAGNIKISNNDTSLYKGWQKLRITIDATVKNTVIPATKVKIDNQAILTAGSYGVGTKTNVATITLLDKLEATVTHTVNNLSDGTGAAQVTFGSRGDIVEYYYTVSVPSSNSADLKKLAIKNIKINQTGIMKFVDGSLKISKNGNGNSNGDNAVQEANLKNNAQIDLDDTAAPKAQYIVQYQMQIIGTTYRSIANNADLTATKLDNATDPIKEPNSHKFPTTTIMPMDKPQAIVKQEVTNTTRPESDNTDKTETAAKLGDKLHYTFRVTTKGKLTNTSIKDIIQTPSQLMDYDANSLKATIQAAGGTPIDLTPTISGFPENGLVQPGDLDANQVLTVSYDRTLNLYNISQSNFILNAGTLLADRLASTDPNAPIEDTEKNQIPFNTTKVNIKTEQNVSVYSSIKNETKPDEDWAAKTDGSKDDVIGYRFIVDANSKNNADVKQIKLTDIAYEPDKDSKNGDMLTYISNSFRVVVDGVKDTGATLSADHKTITLGKPLKKGQMAIVLYQMKVNTEDVDIPVKNHATLSAERLTDKYGDELKDTTGAVTTEMPIDDTTLNLRLGKSQTTIRYVDMDKVTDNVSQQEWLAPAEVAIGKIGEPFSKGVYAGGSKDGTTVGDARVAPKVIDGYTIIAVSESDDIVNNPGWAKAYKDDPLFTKDGRTITYGYRKRMISIEAPTYWDFGERNRSQTDSTYYLEDLKEPQKVQVTDNYGVQSWQLQVAQKAPFTDDRKQELKDAELQFRNGTLSADPNNTTPTQAISTVDHFNLKSGDTVKNLMTYKKSGVFQDADIDQDKSSATNPYSDDQGKGTWTYTFGNKQNAGISIGLYVPYTTKRDNTTYTTTLDWSLTVAP